MPVARDDEEIAAPDGPGETPARCLEREGRVHQARLVLEEDGPAERSARLGNWRGISRRPQYRVDLAKILGDPRLGFGGRGIGIGVDGKLLYHRADIRRLTISRC